MHPRYKSISLLVLFCYFAVIFKLGQFQLEHLMGDKPTRQSSVVKAQTIHPRPGSVLYHDGSPLNLKLSTYRPSLYKPNTTKPADQVLDDLYKIANVNDWKNSRVADLANNDDVKWIDLPILLNFDQYQQAKQIDGLEFTPDYTTHYLDAPQSSLLASLLENKYTHLLSGLPGRLTQNEDALNRPILNHYSLYQNSYPGLDLNTSLDKQIQYLTSEIIKEGVDKYQAVSGQAIVLSSSTGRPLALASISASDSAIISDAKFFTDLIEPGSIFKPLIVALGLEQKAISPDYNCNCSSPPTIDGFTIQNWDKQVHPNSTLQEILKNSDNIGMSSIINLIGLDRFLSFYHQLNLDRKTGIDLPGESATAAKKYWSNIDLATASFGQGIAITPLQMTAAFNVLAYGNWSTPKIAVTASNSDFDLNFGQISVPILSTSTVSHLKTLLRYATQNSAVNTYRPKDLDVCGKSGTAQIALNSGYSDELTNASYIGFFPCDKPKYTILITLQKPQSSTWGSSTAAPIWFDLVTKINEIID